MAVEVADPPLVAVAVPPVVVVGMVSPSPVVEPEPRGVVVAPVAEPVAVAVAIALEGITGLLVVEVAVDVDTIAPGGGGGGGDGMRNHESGTDGSRMNGSYFGGGGGASPLHVPGKGRFGGDGGEAAGGGTEQSARGAVIELQKDITRP